MTTYFKILADVPSQTRDRNLKCHYSRDRTSINVEKEERTVGRRLGSTTKARRFTSITTSSEFERNVASLYKEHYPAARAFALILSGRPDLAEELAQDAFVKVLGRLRQLKLKSPTAFRRYLQVAVLNTFRSHKRFEAVNQLRQAALDREQRHSPDPSESVVRNEIWQAVLTLSPRRRAAVYLHYVEGCSYREIADTLGTSDEAVKSLLKHSLRQLREQLKEVSYAG